MLNMNKPESTEISPEAVENALTELDDKKFFGNFRTIVTTQNNVFDPQNGFLEENDESPNGKILFCVKPTFTDSCYIEFEDFCDKCKATKPDELVSKVCDVADDLTQQLNRFIESGHFLKIINPYLGFAGFYNE